MEVLWEVHMGYYEREDGAVGSWACFDKIRDDRETTI